MLKQITSRLDQLINYLDPLLPLANSHMVDFFTKTIFETHVPLEIRDEINHFGYEKSLHSILNSNFPENQCPKLQKFLTDCKKNSLSCLDDVCLPLSSLQLNLIELGCEDLSGLHLEVFMSSKKSHEVEIMTEISSAVSQIAKSDHIIDIGDGKGYLSSALALHNGLKVLGIDSSDTNTKGAANRVEKLNKIWKGITGNEKRYQGSELYKQTTKYITEDARLNELVQEYFPGDECNNLGLVGLHTCGNLAPSCLRIFINNPNVNTICNVGCCFHLLTENDSESVSGFPMSEYLSQRRYTLGRNARMLSCQSLDRILSEKELPSKTLFYRSLLQILILQHNPQLAEKQVGRLGKNTTTFCDYVNKALKKFEADFLIPDHEINELENNPLYLEVTLQLFYLIRAHVAPVIESVILLDRLLYLHEQGIKNAFLVKMFDAVTSPRCYGLVAFKNDVFK